MIRTTGTSLREKYELQSDILEIIIGGKSPLDSTAPFTIQNIESADQFLMSYGYDLENPIEKAEIIGNFHESLNFIRTHFLQPENPDGLKLDIPRRILELTDVRELFLMANLALPGQTADSSGLLLRNWACSLLKVMHTISHIDKDVRTPYFVDIQKQIFDRFYKLIHRDEEDRLFLGLKADDPLRINLAAFETKPKKSRTSIILKLLHKPENVADDIFDRVGIRFITHTRLDCIRTIKYLRNQMIIMSPNIKPSRSRNTLIPLDTFNTQINDLLQRADRNEIDEKQVELELENAAHQPFGSDSPENPHSSQYYRSIQFTCRRLIKLQNPLYDDLKELKTLIRENQKTEAPLDDIQKMAERINLKYLQKEIRFFYPFEIQVMDRGSAEENEKGKSAHSEYKRAQVMTALKRVMGCFLDDARQ